MIKSFASQEKASLSSWFRQAALKAIENKKKSFKSKKELKHFFDKCDQITDSEDESEPNLDEHLSVTKNSKIKGHKI